MISLPKLQRNLLTEYARHLIALFSHQIKPLPFALFGNDFWQSLYIIDSTTIELVANCMDWARHRRRKAAAKTHMRLDMESMLPRFAIVDTAKHNDNLRARELCAGLKAGEIVIFDRAYNDFDLLRDLEERSVQWVGR